MADSDKPLVLVVCNDYGELAFALYLLAGQPFAANTTLLLPPRLYAKNSGVLPGRTFEYHSLDDVRAQVGKLEPGILGLFSGYLLPIHNLCSTEDLESLLGSTRAQGWKCFTSDPFLGLLDEVEPDELVKFMAPKYSIFWSLFSRIVKMRIAAEAQVAESKLELGAMHRMLQGVLHVYPCGESPKETDQDYGARLHFHNPAIFLQSGHAPAATTPSTRLEQQRWLFVLGNEDYAVQEAKYGRALRESSRKFRIVLLRKLHETLEAGRVPTLIAPASVVDAVRKHSHAADAMELLPHCEYSRFQSLLRDAEYVFYWNAVSFSCILRTLTDKPWFTFDDGHLLRGMNDAYARRIHEWFYRGDEPPRLDINSTLTIDALQQAKKRNMISSWRVRHGLLSSPTPEALFSALEPEQVMREANALVEAFAMVQRLGGIVSANGLDGSFVVDTELLDYPKSDIQGAITLLLERGAAEQSEFARLSAPTLAFFQPGVGAKRQPIDSPGPDGEPWRAAVEADMVAITRDILAAQSPSSGPGAVRTAEEEQALAEAFGIAQRLGEIVAANKLDGSLVVDTALLDHPKSVIQDAIALLLESGAENQAEFARLAAPTMAFFQPGVDASGQAMDSPGPDGKPWRAAVEAEMIAITRDLLAPHRSRSSSPALEPGQAAGEAGELVEALDVVQRLHEIVSANELDGSFVVDIALLAYPKSGIKDAITLLLESGAGNQADFARLAAPTLAFFQPGVGAGRQAIDSPGPNGRPWRAAVEAEMNAITRELSA